jgi:phosphoribosylformylglycinamidine cyclo-ligase
MHLAVGASSWFTKRQRVGDLIDGWRDGCNLAGCTWAGGETPTLRDILLPEAMELSCSVFGIVRSLDRVITPELIEDGDCIVLLGSSGIHDNGLTLCREIAGRLPRGFQTPMLTGKTFGDALLHPTAIYVPVIEEIQNAGIRVHYAVNITGHGWRKLMRAPKPFAYVVDQLPAPHPVFRFIQEQGQIADEEMYGNFNMGAGFALYVRQDDADSRPATCSKASERSCASHRSTSTTGACRSRSDSEGATAWRGHVREDHTPSVAADRSRT